MRILWFPRLDFEIDKLHITTWREMFRELQQNYNCKIKIAIAGKPTGVNPFDGSHVGIFIIKIKYLRILTFLFFGYLKFLFTYFTFRPQVVLLDIYSIWFSIPFALLPRRQTVYIVDNRTPFYNLTSENSGIRDRVMRFYTKLSYSYCRYFLDGMTVITDYYKKNVCKNFKFDDTRIDVWGSGVNIEMFSPQKYKDCTRPSFLKDKFVLMQHGEISYNRGLFETVEAINIVGKEDVCLVLIGDAVGKSKAKEDICALIKKHHLENNVYVLPPVPHSEIPEYIGYCDCAIMAYPNLEYWNNNNPIKLLEYLAMGKVVICTEMWTFKAVMGDKRCAYYIKDNNPATIANAIHDCYQNKKFLFDWGKEGLEIVKEKYTWNKQAKRLFGFIEQLRKDA